MIGLFLINGLLSLGLLLAVWLLSRSRSGIGGACFVCSIAVVFFLFWSPVLCLQALATFVLALICKVFWPKPKAILLSAAASMVLSYLFMLSLSFRELNERAELRKKFPVESVADRLDYEKDHEFALQHTQNPPKEDRLSPKVEERLRELESRDGSNMRRYMLSSLHDRTKDQFVMARGFGPIRMMGVHQEGLDLPEVDPIPLPEPPQVEPSYDSEEGHHEPLADSLPVAGDRYHDALLSLHMTGLEDFLEPDRMGVVENRNRVVGFQPHRFTNLPGIPSEKEPAEWLITRLELISLLKHEEPVAYVSRHLPSMEELKEAPTRPLEGFEQGAIARLRFEEDLVVEEEANQIRMVGSIRAGESCMACHSVRRGELLGAFSYKLHRAKPIRVPANEEPVDISMRLGLLD